MSDTPRTDAKVREDWIPPVIDCVPADFSRDLERELNSVSADAMRWHNEAQAAKMDCMRVDKENEELKAARNRSGMVERNKYLPQISELRAEVERWKESVAHAQREEGKRYSELNAANVELSRLRAGGCARDQRTTQFCAEAVALAKERDELRADCAKWVAELENANRDFCNKAGELNQLKAEVERLIRQLHLADKGHSATIDDRDNWREVARELANAVKEVRNYPFGGPWVFLPACDKSYAKFEAIEKGTP